MKTIEPGEILPTQLHRLLLTAIAPRPIALASTVDASGRPNLSPFSCFNLFGVSPATLIFSPSCSGRGHRLKDTLLNVMEVPEVVINTVTYSMAEQSNLAGAEFPKGINEFVKAGLTPVPSERVTPFRVKESPVQLECKVRQVTGTDDHPGSDKIIICEVLLIHVNKRIFDIRGQLDPRKLDLVGHMGADYYVRASGKALFTLEKPVEGCGVGVDALPEDVRMSTVLTGNDLGKLGSVSSLPTAPEVNEVRKTAAFKRLKTDSPRDSAKMMGKAHQYAHELIARNEIHEALRWLLAVSRYAI